MTETIGVRLERLAREKKKLTLAQFAAEVGVSYETARKWVKGDTAPNRNRVATICTVLGVTPDVVLFGDHAGARRATVVEVKSYNFDDGLERAVRQMASYFEGLDETTRETVANTLPRLVRHPESADEVAKLLIRIIPSPPAPLLADTPAPGAKPNVTSIAAAPTGGNALHKNRAQKGPAKSKGKRKDE